jgi:hypothetical protein
MAGVFICYRRDDTAGWAGRLQADLQAGLTGAVVFRDIDAIPPGVKFDEYIADAVGTCDVLIAMIGPHWLDGADAQGARRLEDPNDLIRLEISTCLKRDIRVIPALVGGARLPAASELPDDIRELARRQAYELSDSRWTADSRRLIAALRLIVGISRLSRRLVAAGVLALVMLTAGLFTFWRTAATTTGGDVVATATQPPSTPQPSEGTAGAQPTPDVPRSLAGGPTITDTRLEGASRPTPLTAKGVPQVEYIATGAQGAGIFEFVWPGGDCWDIYRGDQKISNGCGRGKQALQPGRYTIKNTAALFLPFDVEIKNAVTTVATLGGVFEFKWPGGDCWYIYRGKEKVTSGCSAGKQALQAGRYTIKASQAAIFQPFGITVRDGATVVAP